MSPITVVYTLAFLILTYCILSHSALSLHYAFMGLNLWFQKMVPNLLPFMILSGCMVRMKLTEGFTSIVYFFVRPIYKVTRNVCYGMLMGFLCGFPMGAKTVQELYTRQMITKQEADYLLAFCNNIGPVYFISFVLPLLQRQRILPYVFGMYGIPLLYGLFLRYTFFGSMQEKNITATELYLNKISFFRELDDAISASVQSILSLGGYMILFNLFNLLPHILMRKEPIFLAPLLEISGGLSMLQAKAPLYTLLLLPFGGLSCIAQTYSCLKGTSLSIAKYTLHKIILVVLTALYYLGWYVWDSNSFIR